MQVRVESTLEEVVELAMLAHRYSHRYRLLHWGLGIGVSFATGLGIALATDAGSRGRVVATVAGGATCLLIYHYVSGWINRRYLRASCRAAFSGRPTLPVEVAIENRGLLFKQEHSETLIGWPDIQSAKDGTLGIEIWGHHGFLGLVRSRAFENVEQRHSFAAEINRFAIPQQLPH